MKQLFIFAIFALLALANYGKAQDIDRALNTRLLTIEFVDVPLSQVVKHLEKTSGTQIVIDYLLVDPEQKITVIGKNLTVREILSKISAKYGLGHHIDSLENARLLDKLYNTKVWIDFSAGPITEIIDFLRATTGINMVIHPESLEELGKNLSSVGICVEHPLRLSTWMQLMATIYGIEFALWDGVVIVQKKE